MTGTTAPLTLRIERMLPAGPEDVFDAYTDAGKQKIWFSILDERPGVVEIEVDLRVGGTQTAIWGADPEHLFRETQTFLEIDRPHRLVTESTGSSPDGLVMTTRIEITFEGRFDAAGDPSTLVTVVQSGFPVPEVRDFFVGEVWNGAFARIAAYLERSR
ncbi:MAG: SRPBCC domain-containing protein [Microbacterium pygmaeum]